MDTAVNTAPTTSSSTSSASSGGSSPGQSTPSTTQGGTTDNNTYRESSKIGGGTHPSQSSTPPKPEYFELKINGKTQKLTKDELLNKAQFAEAANQRFEEASRIRKEWEQKNKVYEKNPVQAFLDAPAKLPPNEQRRLLEEYYFKQYLEPETLNEDQRRARRYEQELAEFKQREEQLRQTLEQQEMERVTSQQRELIQKQIIEAMEQSGLPKTAFFISRIAHYMREAARKGYEAPMPMIIRQVQDERRQIIADMTENTDPEKLIEFFGENLVNKIRAHDLKKLREQRAGISQPPVQTQGNSNAGTGPMGGRDKVSYSDVNKKLRDMKRGIF